MSPTAIVTGAASGMGQATADLLLASGWHVIALDRDPIQPDVPEHGQPDRGRLESYQVDITDRGSVGAALAKSLHATCASHDDPDARELTDGAAVADLNGVALVANVAGVYPPSTLETYSEEMYRRTFDINVLGTLNVIAEARRYLRAGSTVVNFASVDAFTVSPGQLLYGASKAAVVMLTKELALELAPERIRVNAIAPGWVDTPGNAATGRMDIAAASIPLGRVATPTEIAAWVLMLAGTDASFMTGETLVLSGGDVLR